MRDRIIIGFVTSFSILNRIKSTLLIKPFTHRTKEIKSSSSSSQNYHQPKMKTFIEKILKVIKAKNGDLQHQHQQTTNNKQTEE